MDTEWLSEDEREYICSACQELLAAERQKNAELVEALKKYGWHCEGCFYIRRNSNALYENTCSCGFHAALAKNGGKL